MDHRLGRRHLCSIEILRPSGSGLLHAFGAKQLFLGSAEEIFVMGSFPIAPAQGGFSSFLVTSALPAGSKGFCTTSSFQEAAPSLPPHSNGSLGTSRFFGDAARLVSRKRIPTCLEHLPPNLAALYTAIQESRPIGPYRFLNNLKNFALTCESLRKQIRHLEANHHDLLCRYQKDPWFMKTLLYLAWRLRAGTLSTKFFRKILTTVCEYSQRLGPKYRGSDLLEKICRELSLSDFMGKAENVAARYELEVARHLVSKRNILEVHPVSQNGIVASPDYCVLIEEGRRDFWIFVEAKICRPKHLSHFGRCGYHFWKVVGDAVYQCRRYAEEHPCRWFAIYVGIIDKRGEVDMEQAKKHYASFALQSLAQNQRGRKKLRRIHIDFFFDDFEKRDILDFTV